jgi:hypothetical protein
VIRCHLFFSLAFTLADAVPKPLAEIDLPAVPHVGDWMALPTGQRQYVVNRVSWVIDASGAALDHVNVFLTIPVIE